MQQRVAVALALCGMPSLLIADEPTSALDVTIQAQLLRMFDDIRKSTGVAILLVTHDLGVVSALADRVIVMNSGLLFESAPVGALFTNPRNPYTRTLLAIARSPAEEHGIPILRTAAVPSQGCPIASQCTEARSACAQAAPPWQPVADQHWSRCWWI
jgi:oligopeptide/dipeptide ABC transporter ATP-binding protein